MAPRKKQRNKAQTARDAVWKNRIVGTGDADPKELLPNPKNWRKHPTAQEGALEGALRDVGWVAPVTVNKRSGKLVDGHLRVALAIKRKEKHVPVQYVDLTPAEERKVLLSLDPIGEMAERDKARLSKLADSVKTADMGLAKLLDGMRVAEATATENPECEIAPELHERQDYLVITFDNEFDWLAACEKLGVESKTTAPVKGTTLSKKGICRVIPASLVLEKLK